MYNFEVVLPKKFGENIRTVEVHIAKIKDKSKTKSLLQLLKIHYPLDSLMHLKRVKCRSDKNLDVIISQTALVDKDVLTEDTTLSGYLHDFRTAYVPLVAPVIRKEFIEASSLWPTKFHEDKRLRNLTKEELFTTEERKKHSEYLVLAENLGKEDNHGTVVVDPSLDKIIATAYDCSSNGDPLHHSVMVALDMVAFSQGGGAYSSLVYTQHENGYICLNKRTEEFSNNMTRVVEIAGYLCTGFDIYTTLEPCIMCSMALVHSRVGKVFYSNVNKNSGGLGSKYQIHCEEGLNHHFEVFRVKN